MLQHQTPLICDPAHCSNTACVTNNRFHIKTCCQVTGTSETSYQPLNYTVSNSSLLESDRNLPISQLMARPIFNLFACSKPVIFRAKKSFQRANCHLQIALGITLMSMSQQATAQQGICVAPQRPVCPQDVAQVPQHEFTFSRLIFADNPVAVHELGDYVGFPHWQADCSDSDPHFISAIKRMTRINTNDHSQSISMSDPAIFDYPAIYMVEAGFASFTIPEAQRLREYLLRGGFLLVDDFHGSYQWSKFQEWMGKVFPDREVVDLPKSHEIFHVHFDIDNFVQIPGLRALCLNHGATWERPMSKAGTVIESNTSRQQPAWRAILDDDGRVMVMINWNVDLGDAWEHADMEEYASAYTSTAYRLGVNYMIYSLTH